MRRAARHPRDARARRHGGGSVRQRTRSLRPDRAGRPVDADRRPAPPPAPRRQAARPAPTCEPSESPAHPIVALALAARASGGSARRPCARALLVVVSARCTGRSVRRRRVPGAARVDAGLLRAACRRCHASPLCIAAFSGGPLPRRRSGVARRPGRRSARARSSAITRGGERSRSSATASAGAVSAGLASVAPILVDSGASVRA